MRKGNSGERRKAEEKSGEKTDENSGHYVIAPERRPLERRSWIWYVSVINLRKFGEKKNQRRPQFIFLLHPNLLVRRQKKLINIILHIMLLFHLTDWFSVAQPVFRTKIANTSQQLLSYIGWFLHCSSNCLDHPTFTQAKPQKGTNKDTIFLFNMKSPR